MRFEGGPAAPGEDARRSAPARTAVLRGEEPTMSNAGDALARTASRETSGLPAELPAVFVPASYVLAFSDPFRSTIIQ